MAYGNWGAFVYKDGVRMQAWEDQTPYKETQLENGYWQAFGRTEGINPHHAVLGEGRVRLCGYKCYPALFLDGGKIDIEGLYDDEISEQEGQLEGYNWSYSKEDNAIELRLVCPDGSVWHSRCGYGIGAGYEE